MERQSGDRIEVFAVPGMPMVVPGQDLAGATLAALAAGGEQLRDGDVLVFAQKVVSKAENRFVDLQSVAPGPEAIRLAAIVDKDPRFVEVVLGQASRVVRARTGVLIVEHKLGLVMANAGIDRSNLGPETGEDSVLLLPEDPDGSADALRAAIRDQTGCDVAVIINDSFGRPWRSGTVGVAIGVAGIEALVDKRGQHDLFDRTLRVTVIGHADEIAAAASIVMGGADEGRPVVVVRGLPAAAAQGRATDLVRPAHEDMFR